MRDPVCLWHHDFRLDNMLFDDVAGVVIIDWQSVAMAPGIADVSLFLRTGLSTEARRKHERDLIGHYHTALVAQGVGGYSLQQCWDEYRAHAAASLFSPMHASVRLVRTERGDAMWKTWIERVAAQVTDLDTIALLASGH